MQFANRDFFFLKRFRKKDMKINSINLIGETLDWAVIECEK